MESEISISEVIGTDGIKDGNWYTWSSVNTGVTTATVPLNLPDSAFPTGGEFKICASSKVGYNMIMPNCVAGINNGGDATVDIRSLA